MGSVFYFVLSFVGSFLCQGAVPSMVGSFLCQGVAPSMIGIKKWNRGRPSGSLRVIQRDWIGGTGEGREKDDVD